MLQTIDFDYYLPEELIASCPSKIRDGSRLMVLDIKENKIEHKKFFDITDYLKRSDVLVLNDTKVIHARLFGVKKTGGNAEILLLRKIIGNIWECMAYPAKRIKKGCIIDFNGVVAEIIEELDSSRRAIKFLTDEEIDDILDKIGFVPLPPYIEKQLSAVQRNDPKLLSRYQTVYADKPGASAAPTAGLHFTKGLIKKIREKGIKVAYITLHTGAGTFIPVNEQYVKDHKMFSEEYEIGDTAAKMIKRAKRDGGRVIAVGTTSVRCLEDCHIKHNDIVAGKDEAKIFIYPPYDFKIVDAMVTNFHFPKSTLLMMVSAFAGKDFIMEAYQEAIEGKYRFYSFGDAMVIM